MHLPSLPDSGRRHQARGALPSVPVPKLLSVAALAVLCTWLWVGSTDSLLALLLLLLAVPPLLDQAGGRFDLFELRNLFCLGYFTQFFLSTLYSRYIEYRYVTEAFFNAHVREALSFVCLGLVAYYIGYYLPVTETMIARLKPLATEWHAGDLQLVAGIYVILSMASWALLIQLTGGLAFVLTHLYEMTQLIEGRTFLFAIAVSLFFAAIVLCELQGRWERSQGYLLAASIFAVVNLGMLLTRGYKFPFAIVALIFWASHHYMARRKRRSGKIWMVAFSLLVLVLVPYYQLFRGEAPIRLNASAFTQLNVTWQSAPTLVLRRYYGVEAFELVLAKVPHQVPYGHGWSLAQFFTSFVPRAIWPGKPLGPSIREAQLFFNDQFRILTGVEPSIPGELYWNFGVAGIVIGMFLLGLLCRAVYVWFRRNPNRSGLMLYLPWIFWAFECNDGNLADSLYSYVVVYLVPVALAYFLIAYRRRSVVQPSYRCPPSSHRAAAPPRATLHVPVEFWR